MLVGTDTGSAPGVEGVCVEDPDLDEGGEPLEDDEGEEFEELDDEGLDDEVDGGIMLEVEEVEGAGAVVTAVVVLVGLAVARANIVSTVFLSPQAINE